jgi:hypothetical protein
MDAKPIGFCRKRHEFRSVVLICLLAIVFFEASDVFGARFKHDVSASEKRRNSEETKRLEYLA